MVDLEEDCDSLGGNEDEELNENEELVDLPEELADLRGVYFDTDRALDMELEQRGWGDLRVVLWDGYARLVEWSEQHCHFKDYYTCDFRELRRKWGYCSGILRVHLSNGCSRYPSISYWGYPRCDKHPTSGLPCFHLSRIPIPDVVIQFCWGNVLSYEKQSIEDILSKCLEYEGGPVSTDLPRLGYLIKIRLKRKMVGQGTKEVIGLDVYRLPHGTTVKQALDPTDPSAEHWRYEPGGPKVLISIGPEDLGIPPTWGSHFFKATAGILGTGVYTMKASEIFDGMHKFHAGRQQRGLAA
jgi:hypothetical protein